MVNQEHYLIGHHDKANWEIYQVVPKFFGYVLDAFPEIEVVVIGGSYASGEYKLDEDIDVDIAFTQQLSAVKIDEIKEQIIRMGFENAPALQVHIRGHTSSEWAKMTPESLKSKVQPRDLIISKVSTPYIARSGEVARFWGLEE